jgi:hypothetical protein
MKEHSIIKLPDYYVELIKSIYRIGIENAGRTSDLWFFSSPEILDKSMYNTKIVSSETFFCDMGNEKLLNLLHKYIRINDESEYISNVHYIKYIVGEGAKPHTDNSISDKSYILLLNDEFEGGEFYLDNKPIKFKKGDLLEFDGHLLHEVKEITKGYREVLVIFSKKKLKVKKTLL